MSELQWRKEPPDKPGWWWVIRPRGKPEIVEAFTRLGSMWATQTGSSRMAKIESDFYEGSLWVGPIEPPK